MEAVLPEVVRRAAAVRARQLPEDGRAVEQNSQRQGRDVREPAAGRQARAASRSLCRIAALSSGTGDAESPGECRIFIDGEPYSWRDGEDLLFDETYLHYAEITTSDERIILFCDIERPLKTQTMTAVNRWVSKHIINESATQNEEGERVGWINRIFGYVYYVRLAGKRMKAWNKRVYYTVKYLLIGGILAAFLATAFA